MLSWPGDEEALVRLCNQPWALRLTSPGISSILCNTRCGAPFVQYVRNSCAREDHMIKASREFQIFAKPIGAICNLDCHYCYYLQKELLYPQTQSFRMPKSAGGVYRPTDRDRP